MRITTIDAAAGKWRGILTHFGFTELQLSGKHTSCPDCGGSDRWRFDDKSGTGSFICNSCGSGYGMDLVMKSIGGNFADAAKAVDQIIGNIEADKPKKEKSVDEIRADIKRTLSAATRIDEAGYLAARGITSRPDVRFHNSLEYWHEGKVTNHPAMIGIVMDQAGKGVAIHRTYLKQGGKADVDSPRKMSKAISSLSGSAIRLYPATGEILGVAEGIETACSAHQLFNIPVWSCISSTLLESFSPPEGIKSVVIFGDNDKNFAGQKSAYVLANRLALKGYHVDVEIPVAQPDWNDVLMESA